MDDAKRAEAEIEDTRPDIAGFILPWKITEPSKLGTQEIVDADGDTVIAWVEDDDLYAALVPHVNRVAALEAALIKVFRKFDSVAVHAPGEVSEQAKAAHREAEEIIYEIGLAHRVWDDSAGGGQVTP